MSLDLSMTVGSLLRAVQTPNQHPQVRFSHFWLLFQHVWTTGLGRSKKGSTQNGGSARIFCRSPTSKSWCFVASETIMLIMDRHHNYAPEFLLKNFHFSSIFILVNNPSILSSFWEQSSFVSYYLIVDLLETCMNIPLWKYQFSLNWWNQM